MFPHSTIEHFTPKRGYVTLTGKVDPTPEYAIEALAVMPFVWRFAPVHGTDEDHGWRRASRHDHYGLDEQGQWTVTDVRPGVQYAVVVVQGEYFKQSSHPERMLDVLADTLIDDGGTLPGIGLGLPEFTHRKYGIHIGSAPEDHLTGTVLGVSRATWDEPGADGPAGDPFHVAAWATNPAGTFFIGVRDCEPNGYWTFGAIVESLKTAHNFTVALVGRGFNPPDDGAPSPLPVLGPNILGLDSRPYEPLRTHGSGNSSRR
jgi:hypothetical protein